MVGMKTEKIGRFIIIQQTDYRGRVVKTVFLNYISVAHFSINEANERKIAAIGLVER